ncbi:MAG: sulfotransferase [Myxococcota bacterium]|nr:sulfotransferase [Myxococcota bacterium]
MSTNPIFEKIEGEPDLAPAGTGKVILTLIQQTVVLLLISPFTLLFGILYFLIRIVARRPPTIPNPKTVFYYIKRSLFWQTAHNEIVFSMRLRLLLSMFSFLAFCPMFALAWYIDDVFFPGYRTTPIVRPLFIITGSRSGSTQLSQYLEENPQVVSHPLLLQIFPYIWLWKLAPKLLGRFFPEEKLVEVMKKTVPAGFLERKEFHPLKPETFEIIFSGSQLVNHSMAMGAEMFAEGYGWGRTTPNNAEFWEKDLVDVIEQFGKKMIYAGGSKPDGSAKTLVIKGHFLGSADSLERRFPDAHFLTILRHPSNRIRSIMNFFRVAPEVCVNGGIPWPWLVHYGRTVEVNYSLYEKEWYQARSENTTIIRFRDYVDDLETTLRIIYERCLPDVDWEGYIPSEHAPRKRSGYSVNRTYEQLNIDEEEFLAPLAEYIEWVNEPCPYTLKAEDGD